MLYLEVFLASGASRSGSPLVRHYRECIEYE
jgi:hypothetical protein